MYDRISLIELLKKLVLPNAASSHTYPVSITDWKEFHLDNTESGEPRKPDSLYLEAVKPK
jgi:hypothetical protein